jgi:uncharacterized membrane protein YeaQ/YmgE (transglycosylase-associated protein family)
MYSADAVVTSHLMQQTYRIGQSVAGGMIAGWIAERMLDTGLRVPGVAPFAGLVGLYVGPALWSIAGWRMGPSIGDFPIVPALAGAFAVCGMLKLVGLGLAGPKW